MKWTHTAPRTVEEFFLDDVSVKWNVHPATMCALTHPDWTFEISFNMPAGKRDMPNSIPLPSSADAADEINRRSNRGLDGLFLSDFETSSWAFRESGGFVVRLGEPPEDERSGLEHFGDGRYAPPCAEWAAPFMPPGSYVGTRERDFYIFPGDVAPFGCWRGVAEASCLEREIIPLFSPQPQGCKCTLLCRHNPKDMFFGPERDRKRGYLPVAESFVRSLKRDGFLTERGFKELAAAFQEVDGYAVRRFYIDMGDYSAFKGIVPFRPEGTREVYVNPATVGPDIWRHFLGAGTPRVSVFGPALYERRGLLSELAPHLGILAPAGSEYKILAPAGSEYKTTGYAVLYNGLQYEKEQLEELHVLDCPHETDAFERMRREGRGGRTVYGAHNVASMPSPFVEERRKGFWGGLLGR